MNGSDTRYFGKYEVRGLLGRGGMATVYEGIHPELDRRVAIKLMLPQLAIAPGFEERFRREARLVASLRHPHIVQLYDFDIADGQPYMVMEYLEGGTLGDRLNSTHDDGKLMSFDEMLVILDAMAGALDYAHARGAVHRDIKPGNILFTATGDPVLSDFGIARLLEDSAQLTLTGGVVGSPAYMSPEQAEGLKVDGRSDLYTLGVVLFEMATGRVPFEGPTPTAVLLKHVQATPPPPSRLNPQLTAVAERVILRSLAKNPNDRFASCGEFAQAFRESLMSRDLEESDDVTSPDAATLADPAPDLAAASSPVEKRVMQRIVDENEVVLPPVDEIPAQESGAGLFTRGLNAVDVLAPLLGKEPQARPQEEGRRSRLMAVLGAFTILVALLQYLTDLANLIRLPAGALSRLLPWLLVTLLVAVAVTGINVMRQASTSKTRLQAAGMLIAVAMFALTWGGWTLFQALRPPEHTRIVIADFDDRHATTKRDMARRFEQSLHSEFDSLGIEVDLVMAKQFFENSESARKYGDEKKALMVIWGWYDDGGVGPRIELLETHDVSAGDAKVLLNAVSYALPGRKGTDASLSTEIVRYSHVPATVPSLEFVSELSDQELTYVATAAVGLGLFANQQYSDALDAFDRALSLGGDFGDSILGREYPHFYRAVLLDILGRGNEGVPDLEQAVALNPDLFETHYNLALAYSQNCTSQSPLLAAVTEAEDAVRLRPDSLDALRLLGELYIELSQVEQAIGILQKATELAPADVGAQLLLGNAYDHDGQSENALQAYAKAQSLLTENVGEGDGYDHHIRAGDLFVLRGDYDSALSEYQAAQLVDAERAATYRGLGNAYYWMDEIGQALTAYQQWADLNPADADAWLMVGLTHIARDESDQAIKALRTSSELSQCDPAPHLLLGGQLVLAEDFSSAIEPLEKAVKLDPTDIDVQYILASTYYQSGDYDSAIETIDIVLEARPDDASAWRVLSQAAAEGGDTEHALVALQHLSELEAGDGDVHSLLADAYFQNARFEEALAAYESALASREDGADLGSAALTAAMLDDMDAAKDYASRALAIDAKSAGALMAMGFVSKRAGDYDTAIAAYEQALSGDENALTYRLLAESYDMAGQPQNALSAYEQAVALDSQDYLAYLQMGNLHARLNDLVGAESAYRSGLEVNELGHEAWFGLGDVAYRQCNLTTAIQSFQTASSQMPENTLYGSSLAAVLDAGGREVDANAIYEELALAPDGDAPAHLAVAGRQFRLGNLDRAAETLERFLASESITPAFEGLVRNNLADIYMAQGRTLPAQGEYELALQKWPILTMAQASIGDILLIGGDAEAALRAYDQAEQILPQYQIFFTIDQGILQEVLLQLRRAIAFENMGDLEASVVTREAALERAQILLHILPRAPISHYTIMLVQSEMGNNEAAEEAFSLALQCDQSLQGVRTQTEERLMSLRDGAQNVGDNS